MIYLIMALKSEVQAFVDKYKLQNEKIAGYKVFKNQKMMIIVSGIGVYNSMLATQALINQFDITDDDIYINIGICGADTKYKIGELIEITDIQYQEKYYSLGKDKEKKVLTCVDKEVSEVKDELVDMESFGFYDAVTHSPAIKQIYIFKVVSDHFEPHTITKDNTKALIFNQIESINQRVLGT